MSRDFVDDLASALGDRMRADDCVAVDVYAAMCNVDWAHTDGTQFSCSWRTAGGYVNDIVNPGDDDPMGYCNYYCSGNEGEVAPEVSNAMAALGWNWSTA